METYISRKIEKKVMSYMDNKEVIVLTGFRRVGKTALMQNIYDSLKTDNKIFLDLESPINQRIFSEQNYDNIVKSLNRFGLDFTKRAYVFLDEIQILKNTPSVVKYLYDHYNIKFCLTGSSSFYLKNYFNESMSGRKYVFELFPLDFEEFLQFKNAKLSVGASYDFLSGFYQEYLEYGGFPAVVLANSLDTKRRALDDVLGSYFELDVKTLSDFRDNENLKKLLFLLTSRVGNKLEVTKLAESLGVSRPTVYEYLNFFEQTYLIHLIKPLSGSKDIQIKSVPKLYFNDTGLLNQIGQVSIGQLFENKVFNQLYTKLQYFFSGKFSEEKLNYYQLKSGAEIDFVERKEVGYEVKVNATQQDYDKLAKYSDKLRLKEYKVVSLKETALVAKSKAIYPFGL